MQFERLGWSVNNNDITLGMKRERGMKRGYGIAFLAWCSLPYFAALTRVLLLLRPAYPRDHFMQI
jgi:hypothetical protein